MNTKTTPKDFFLHLGATIVLYTVVVALMNFVFSIINYTFPDQLARGYYYASSISWPLSMVIILIPILYLLEWFIRREYMKEPEKKGIWIRRWRIYLTISLAVATIVGDLISLVYTYLNGEISDRFVFKVLAVFIISAFVLAFYIFDLVNETRGIVIARRFVVWIGLALVIAGVIWGMSVFGSPTKQRKVRFDSQKVSDLSRMQSNVIQFWQKNSRLPENTDQLRSEYGIPTDVENKQEYKYSKTGSTTFELCAEFNYPTQDNTGRGSYYGDYYSYDYSYPVYSNGVKRSEDSDFWKHEAGRHCFEREIDVLGLKPQVIDRDIN